MRIINEPAIVKFADRYVDSRQWLENWVKTVGSANWRTIQNAKLTYPATDGGVRVASGAKVTVFDVGGNKYRMIADVNFAVQTIVVLELMTHSEYSKRSLEAKVLKHAENKKYRAG